MRIFKKVTVIGTGLIGGSIALGLKRKGLAARVVGISRSRKTASLARKMRAVDFASRSLTAAKGSDLVILAAPPEVILKLAPSLSKIIGRDCIVTDAASTKEEIVNKLGSLFKRFVGAHPLAGSEKKGIENASSQMFKNALCILTPVAKTDPEALKKVKKLWFSLGSRLAFLSPARHDEILSFVSHLPHIVSFSLMESIPPQYLRFAASGLKDATRLAASDPQLWQEIILSNKDNSLRAVAVLEKNLAKIKSALRRKDAAALNRIFKSGSGKREALA